MKRLPRGIRNNNPGNIRRSRDPWQGLAAEQQDVAFFTFASMADGVRAAARIFITYYDKHNLSTVREIIDRWAPPVENNTDAYVSVVAAALDVDPDAPIDLQEYAVLKPLLKAVFKHENGGNFVKDADLDEGLRRAGVINRAPTRPMRDPQVATTAVATASTVATGAVAYSEIRTLSSELRDEGVESGSSVLVYVGWGLSMVSLVLLGVLAYKRLRLRSGK